MRAVIAAAVVLVGGAAGCAPTGHGPSAGSLPSGSPPSTATTSPTLATPSAAVAFRAGDCSSPPAQVATMTEPLTDNFHVILQIPSGWTREPAGHSQTQLLVIDAPTGYSHQLTTIGVLSLLGYFPNESPRDIAPQYYGPSVHADVPSINLVGAVTDCQVQGDPAAFFQYTQGDRGGYLVLFLHSHYLYGVRVEGSGGVDPLAIDGAKQILGSIQWTVTTPPAR